jgi:hypothetical protein
VDREFSLHAAKSTETSFRSDAFMSNQFKLKFSVCHCMGAETMANIKRIYCIYPSHGLNGHAFECVTLTHPVDNVKAEAGTSALSLSPSG